MKEADRKFLASLNKRLYSERLLEPDRFGFRTLLTEYNDKEKVSAEELKRVLAIVKENEDLMLLPTSTTWGFGGPCYYVGRIEKPSPFIKDEIVEALVHIKTCQMPKGWGWDRMLKHFPSEELMKFYGLEMYNTSAAHYDY